MVFANPSYLWALWGLLVPLAIHLWSKKEAKTIKIGSIQLLDESNSRQSSSLQLNEWFLLLLRMLIIALAVMLMAGPQWRTHKNRDLVTYIVEPSLVGHHTLDKVLDSLNETSEVLLLKNGFPEWEMDMENPGAETPNYWQLAQKMDSLPSDSIVIFAHTRVQGFKSARPSTHKKINWVIMEPENLEETPLIALGNDQDIELVSMVGDGQNNLFKKQKLSSGFSLTENKDSLSLETDNGTKIIGHSVLNPIKVSLYSDTETETQTRYIEASLAALSNYLQRDINVQTLRGDEQPDGSPADLNIWLRSDSSDAFSGKWLVFHEDPLAKRLIVPGTQEERYHLTNRLTAENTVEEHFAEQLLTLLDLDADIEEEVLKADFRQMDASELKPNYVEPKSKRKRATFKDMSHWAFLALLIVMMVERVVAHLKKQ
ncbi:BatA domain-containing protein [Flagellimonas baculiformis]|uniref:BatA domain-containing protein n=1 Tax=Flagellimonas baculiformis TaxID=3067310 RepID=UPI00296F1CA6|nr:BatA domain-containing protein [Muricauda sp. D6]